MQRAKLDSTQRLRHRADAARAIFAIAAARASAQHALDALQSGKRSVDEIESPLDPIKPHLDTVDPAVDASDRLEASGKPFFERGHPHLEVGDLGGEQIDLGVDAAQQRQNEVGGFLDHRRKIAPMRAKAKPLSRSGVTTTAAELLADNEELAR